MDKRRVAVLAVGVTLAALFGAGAAMADNTGDSTRCTNGTSGETVVPVPFVGVAYEAPAGAIGPDYVAVCYSTTPHGSSSPEAAGGYFLVANPLTNDHANLICKGDRATTQSVVVECENRVTFTDPMTAPGTTATSTAKVGTTGPVNVGQTGAEVNPATSTNAPLSGAAGSGGSLGVGTGTCTYVNGGTPTCPFGITILGVTVNEADLVPAVTPSTPTPPCIGIDNTCVPVAATVRLFQDTSRPTLSVTTSTSTSPTTVDAAPTGRCVQVNATC